MKILGLSGSLRKASYNTAFLKAAAQLAPPPYKMSVYDSLGDLPLFNPDFEVAPPHEVSRLREAVEGSDAIIICSPEYAHGVTGVMKNALDWLVSFPPFAGKLVAVVNTSPTAYHADAALKETLTTMSAVIVAPACVQLALLGSGLDEKRMGRTPWLVESVHHVFAKLASATNQPSA